jgi:hypothetical protein
MNLGLNRHHKILRPWEEGGLVLRNGRLPINTLARQPGVLNGNPKKILCASAPLRENSPRKKQTPVETLGRGGILKKNPKKSSLRPRASAGKPSPEIRLPLRRWDAEEF